MQLDSTPSLSTSWDLQGRELAEVVARMCLPAMRPSTAQMVRLRRVTENFMLNFNFKRYGI